MSTNCHFMPVGNPAPPRPRKPGQVIGAAVLAFVQTAVALIGTLYTYMLSALVVAAAGAVGMPGLGPPVARQGAGEIAVALLCLEGHIVLHCAPAEGVCLIDIVARAPADVGKGIDVISRRLAI